MSGDETQIGRVLRAMKREGYEGPERRNQPVEWLKWLPLGVAVITGAMGYGALQTRVDSLERQMERQWDVIGKMSGVGP